MRISWKDSAEEARAAVCATFDGLPRRVHGPKDLEMLLQKHRRRWRLLAGVTVTGLIGNARGTDGGRHLSSMSRSLCRNALTYRIARPLS